MFQGIILENDEIWPSLEQRSHQPCPMSWSTGSRGTDSQRPFPTGPILFSFPFSLRFCHSFSPLTVKSPGQDCHKRDYLSDQWWNWFHTPLFISLQQKCNCSGNMSLSVPVQCTWQSLICMNAEPGCSLTCKSLSMSISFSVKILKIRICTSVTSIHKAHIICQKWSFQSSLCVTHNPHLQLHIWMTDMEHVPFKFSNSEKL